MSATEEAIVKVRGVIADEIAPYFINNYVTGTKSWGTSEILTSIQLAGESLGYVVWPRPVANAHSRQGERGYDACWQVMEGDYLVRQVVVVESELSERKIKDSHKIDFDFLKLVQARADVKLWITQCGTADLAAIQLAACLEQLKLFSQRTPDETYFLVVATWHRLVKVVEICGDAQMTYDIGDHGKSA